MKNKKIKRVFLVDDTTNSFIIYHQDFLGTTSDEDILNSLYEVGKTIWFGTNLYHIIQQNGQVLYLRYEIRYIKTHSNFFYKLFN